MTSFYEAATSGLNFDRFAEEIPSSSSLIGPDSALAKMRQHFWTAKQLVREKVLRKKEDAHLLASDADFDTKLSRYLSIRNTTREMLAAIEDYHHFVGELMDSERDLGDFLHSESKGEKEHLEKVMKVSGNCLRQISKYRQKTIKPLIRLYHDLDVFNERAIADCASTVDASEKVRLEYRGSLLWIKNASEELDPSNSMQMEKFRTAQTVCRLNKDKFDKLKHDTLQKVDLLAESRSKLLSELAAEYAKSLLEFYETSTETFKTVVEGDLMASIDTYEIDILRILNDPVGLAMEKQKEEKRLAEERRIAHQKNKSRNRAERPPEKEPVMEESGRNDSSENDSNMIELDDIEVGQIVTGYRQPDLFFDNVPLESAEGARTANQQIPQDSNEDIQMESISLGTTIQNLSLSDTGSSPLARRRQAVARRRGTDSDGVFRVESPLGILDDSKFEDEEISHDNVNNVSDPLLHDIIDKNEQHDKSTLSFQNSAPPPRLQPPPSGIPSYSMSNKADVKNKEITTTELLSMDVSQNLPVQKGNSSGFWNPFTGNATSKATSSTSDWPAGCSAMTTESANMDWASLFLKEMDQTKMDDSAANNSLLM